MVGYHLNMFKSAATEKAPSKSELTAQRILDAALDLFRTKGFDQATMRDVAGAAGVATGAAYYYYPSKDAIVLAFYERACAEMQPHVEAALEDSPARLEALLEALVSAKLEYFAPYRGVLRALLKNGADPAHPLSPFAENNKAIRDADIATFARALAKSGMRVPKDLEPHMPGVLWMFQMGVIFFWITDDSEAQRRTTRLLGLSTKIVASLLRIAGLPLTRPLRRVVVELIETVESA